MQIPTFDAFAHVAASELVTRSIRMMMESGCEEVRDFSFFALVISFVIWILMLISLLPTSKFEKWQV